jgi:hypothetical protein
MAASSLDGSARHCARSPVQRQQRLFPAGSKNRRHFMAQRTIPHALNDPAEPCCHHFANSLNKFTVSALSNSVESLYAAPHYKPLVDRRTQRA